MKVYRVKCAVVYTNYSDPKDNYCKDVVSATVLAKSAMAAAEKYIKKLVSEKSTNASDKDGNDIIVKPYPAHKSVDLDSIEVVTDVEIL